MLYPQPFQFKDHVSEFFPSQLPPLRADAPTLGLGGFLQTGKSLAYTVQGTVAGRPVSISMNDPVVDSEVDNFFLVGLYDQWKSAKDQPAMMHADRTLASAYQLNNLACEDLLAQSSAVL